MKHIARRQLLAVQQSQVCIQASDRIDYAKDEVEAFPSENVFSAVSAIMVLCSMVAYVFDVCSSATACYFLFQEENTWWFVLTIVPLVGSLVIVNGFSIRWYVHDLDEAKFLMGDISKVHWGLRVFFHVIVLGPVIRYLELFSYGLHSLEHHDPNREAFKVLVLQEDRDISLLALVGSFIKSAPQLVLQIYILLQNKRMIHLNTAHAQEVSVVVSIATLALSLTSYHRALRRSTPSKLNMTPLGSSMQFLSHLCIISCRVLTLAAFATVYNHWLFLFMGIHWGIMTSWLIFQKTSFCSTESGERRTFDELVFNFIVALIYIFCFLNVKDEPTKWKYTFYYVLVWIENIALATLWHFQTQSEQLKLPLLLAVLLGFLVGLSILGLYYKYFHPNKISRLTTFIQIPVDIKPNSEAWAPD